MNDATKSDTSEAPALDLGAAPAGSYRVLARKYRPSNFDDVIGQDAMVRTISNAFDSGRIPQAWILTGVRGVGKTTTARILARALNYELADGSVTGPTITMPTLGVHCQAIMESRHFDVIEMDAASNRRIDDVRQINDAVRYAPVSARYKVYILDEVHMLTPEAFNALLKTLEEPPPHAKFIFATTEIRKVPVTVLSRCQRFDLRRIDTATLTRHLQGVAGKENIGTETEALALIARAAEGSVRDALSLFDQAIAHAAGPVRAQDVRDMLGLADRARVIDLFEALMKGDVARALAELRDQYDSGADPSVVLADLAEFTHFVTRVKVVPAVADDISLGEAERTRGRAFAATLSMRVLSRAWQMLFKGIAEVQAANRPIAAAEMVLVRLAYVADLPTPDEALRMLDGQGTVAGAPGNGAAAPAAGSGSGARGATAALSSRQDILRQDILRQDILRQDVLRQDVLRPDPPRGASRASLASALPSGAQASGAPTPQEAEAPVPTIDTFEQMVALAAERRDLQIKAALERDVRLVRCEDGTLEIALEARAPKTLVNDLSRKLQLWTGRRWMVIVSGEQGAATLRSQADARQAELEVGVRADPLVKAVLTRFPGAEIVGVRGQSETMPGAPAFVAQDGVPPVDDDGSFGDNWVRDDGND